MFVALVSIWGSWRLYIGKETTACVFDNSGQKNMTKSMYDHCCCSLDFQSTLPSLHRCKDHSLRLALRLFSFDKKTNNKHSHHCLCFKPTFCTKENLVLWDKRVEPSSGLVIGQLQQLSWGVSRISVLAALQFSHVLSGLVMDLDCLSWRTWRTTVAHTVSIQEGWPQQAKHISTYMVIKFHKTASPHQQGRCASSAAGWRWASWASWMGWRGLWALSEGYNLLDGCAGWTQHFPQWTFPGHLSPSESPSSSPTTLNHRITNQEWSTLCRICCIIS